MCVCVGGVLVFEDLLLAHSNHLYLLIASHVHLEIAEYQINWYY